MTPYERDASIRVQCESARILRGSRFIMSPPIRPGRTQGRTRAHTHEWPTISGHSELWCADCGVHALASKSCRAQRAEWRLQCGRTQVRCKQDIVEIAGREVPDILSYLTTVMMPKYEHPCALLSGAISLRLHHCHAVARRGRSAVRQQFGFPGFADRTSDQRARPPSTRRRRLSAHSGASLHDRSTFERKLQQCFAMLTNSHEVVRYASGQKEGALPCGVAASSANTPPPIRTVIWRG